jgi:hypothetical protein
MSVSRPCDECLKVKRCALYVRASYRVDSEPSPPGRYVHDFHEERAYLCRPCARSLGYSPRPRGTKRR